MSRRTYESTAIAAPVRPGQGLLWPLRLLPGLVLLLLVFALAACNGGGGKAGDGASQSGASVRVMVAIPQSPLSGSTGPTYADVGSVTAEIYDGEHRVAARSLAKDESGTWLGVLEDLPLGRPLVIVARGRHWSTGVEIFRGAQIASTRRGTTNLGLVLTPVESGTLESLPRIEQIALPPQIRLGESAEVTFLVYGPPGGQVSHALTSGGGSFTKTAGTLILPSHGYGVLRTDYKPPADSGAYVHTFRLTTVEGNAVAKRFSTIVVDDSASIYQPLTHITLAECPNGGVRISLGIDENGNGVLDLPAEEDTWEVFCNGVNGVNGVSSLVVTATEPPGANCANGGLRVESGMDDGLPTGIAGNGALEAGEVETTGYVCNRGDVLIRTALESPGSNCVGGGTRIEIGLDDNANGVLDPGEVSATDFICAAEPFGEGLVFMADKEVNNQFELFRAREDGTETAKLIGSSFQGGNVKEYAISPDGSRAWVLGDLRNQGTTDLYVVDLQNGGPPLSVTNWLGSVPGTRIAEREISANPMTPRSSLILWARDGTRLAYLFERMDAGYAYWASTHLAVVNLAAGTGAVEVTPDVSASHYLNVEFFLWSPDSSQLAFVADVETDGVAELFSVNHDGTGLQKLNGPLVGGSVRNRFRWSPDGSRIAYAAPERTGSVWDLHTVRPDGLERVMVADHGLADTINYAFFRWSPDSSMIAYKVQPGGSVTQADLWVSPAAAFAPIKVSGAMQANGMVNFFQWSPDSTRIAYLADQVTDGVEELYVSTTDESSGIKVSGTLAPGATLSSQKFYNARWLSGLSGDHRIWSPDSTHLAFGVDTDGDSALEAGYVTTPNGIGLAQFNGGLGDVMHWSPDSSRLAFLAQDVAQTTWDVFTVLPDGTGRVQVSGDHPADTYVDFDFKWSPDGARIAYPLLATDTNQRTELRVALADGSTDVNVAGAMVTYGGISSFLWRDIRTRTHVTMTALTIGPDQPYMESDAVYRLRAWAEFSDDTSREVSASVAWSSDGWPIAGVATDGVPGRIASEFGTSGYSGWVYATDPETGLEAEVQVRVQDMTFTNPETETHYELSPIDTISSEIFGFSVALSGNRALVSAYLSNQFTTNSGAAYVLDRDGTGAWGAPVILPDPGVAFNEQWGNSVAMEGDLAIVGMIRRDVGGFIDAGSAFIYRRDPTTNTWVLEQELTAADNSDSSWFGHSLAISGETALVGAYLKSDGINGSSVGAAYLFRRGWDGAWRQEAKLMAPVADRAGQPSFGWSVALEDDVAVVGAINADIGGFIDSGATYVFQRTNGVWNETPVTLSVAQSSALHGGSVAVDRGRVLAGVRQLYNASAGGDTGGAMLYEQITSVWSTTATLYGTQLAEAAGRSVSLSGNQALLGAYAWEAVYNTAPLNIGRGLLFRQSGGSWGTPNTLQAGNESIAGDWLGYSGALSGSLSILGAPYRDNGAYSNVGAIYIFE